MTYQTIKLPAIQPLPPGEWLILYYDIAWNTHSIRVTAHTLAEAIKEAMRQTRCCRNEIHNYYPSSEDAPLVAS